MGAHPEMVLMAPGWWDLGWAGTTDQQVPATSLHLVEGDAPVTLCGWPTRGLVAFRESAFEPKCADCLAQVELGATGSLRAGPVPA
jgi:hypothetical protein